MSNAHPVVRHNETRNEEDIDVHDNIVTLMMRISGNIPLDHVDLMGTIFQSNNRSCASATPNHSANKQAFEREPMH